MHDALGVRGVQRIRHLNGDPDGFGQRQGRAANVCVEGLALDVFHRQKADTVRLADLEHARHVGVAQRRSGLGLLHEAAHAVGIARHFRRQDLQGDGTLQVQVLGQVDFAHAASAEAG